MMTSLSLVLLAGSLRFGTPQIFFAVLAVLILWPLLRSFAASAPKQQRAIVFGRMGFTELPSSQAFGNDASLIARALRDTTAASISTWVGTGKSPIGDTFLFEFRDNADTLPSLVIAFALPAALKEFQISHVLLLDRWTKQQAQPGGPVRDAPQSSTEIKVGPFKVVSRGQDVMLQPVTIADPEFANKYRVWAADEAAFRPHLTPALMERLSAMSEHNLHIKSWRNWLFVYHDIRRQISPEKYPALLEEAVQLARLLVH